MRRAPIRLLLTALLGLLLVAGLALAAVSSTGSLTAARTQATATALPGGVTTSSVLVAGGFNAAGAPLITAERYDPATGGWSAAGSMNVVRAGHHAILLPSGNVFVVGGLSAVRGIPSPTTSAEQYDPVKNGWTTSASQTTARQQDAAVLATFRGTPQVLVIGGQTAAAGVLPSVEAYSPAANQWSTVASMGTPRRQHAAVTLPDGRVLVAGGRNTNGAVLATTEIFNPATNAWATGPTMATARAQFTLSVVDGTNVLAAGGVTTGSAATATSEVLNPTTTGGWQSAGTMAVSRANHKATVVRSGWAVMTGGTNAASPGGLDSAESWTPTNGWGGLYNLPGSSSIGAARVNHVAAALPQTDEVLVAGGGTATAGTAGTALAQAARWTPDKPVVAPTTTGPTGTTGTSATTPATTGPSAPLATPIQNRSLVASTVSGNVFVRIGKTDEYRELRPGEPVPVGTVLDTSDGRVQLTAAIGKGQQTAWFWGGTFTVLQPKGQGGYVEIRLFGKPVCEKASKKAERLVKRKKKPKVWGDGKGRFRTRGAHSSASVRGTKWLVEERCTGTFTKVQRGLVSVRDFPRHKTISLKAGKNYLAKPRAPR